MTLSYSGLEIGDLGEFTVTQQREFEDGQRVKVTLRVAVTLFERTYFDNYALVQQITAALRTQNGVLQWTNDDSATDYVNQTVTVVSSDLPEEWGTYQMPVNLVFMYYEQGLVTNNLPLTYTPTNGKALTLGNVTRFSEAASAERFSPFHSQRVAVKGEVSVSGWLLVDTTLALADRRGALAQAKADFLAAMTTADGLLQFGAEGSVFNRVVRPERPTVEIDQLLYAVNWTFTASYAVFPDEADFATVDYQAEERDPETGEKFLLLSGKITATDEALARGQLAALLPVALAQYGYDGDNVVQMRSDTSPHTVSANADGGTFTELSFTIEFKTWRADNQEAAFTKTGNTEAVPLGNVRIWELAYQGRRFNDMRSQRQRAGGTLSASGTLAGNPADSLTDRRAALLAAQEAMLAEVNGADGTLTYGAFEQVVRVEELRANINQAITGIDWTMTANYSLFPNESGYATCEFTATPRTNNEDGEETLNVSGRILAPDETLARAKLAALMAKVAQQYGYAPGQAIRNDVKVVSVYANGDQTAGRAAMEDQSDDFKGTTFIELSFEQEYRRRVATLVSWAMQSASKSDGGSGLVMTTFTGTVAAGGAIGPAYNAAVAKARWLAARGASQLGASAVKLSEQLTWDSRQVTAAGIEEGVRLAFAFEYQAKLGAGWSQVQLSTETNYTAIGVDTTAVSGAVVAMDGANALPGHGARQLCHGDGDGGKGADGGSAIPEARRDGGQHGFGDGPGGDGALPDQQQRGAGGSDGVDGAVPMDGDIAGGGGDGRALGPGGGATDSDRHGNGGELRAAVRGGGDKLWAVKLHGDGHGDAGDHGEPVVAAGILVHGFIAGPGRAGGGPAFGDGEQRLPDADTADANTRECLCGHAGRCERVRGRDPGWDNRPRVEGRADAGPGMEWGHHDDEDLEARFRRGGRGQDHGTGGRAGMPRIRGGEVLGHAVGGPAGAARRHREWGCEHRAGRRVDGGRADGARDRDGGEPGGGAGLGHPTTGVAGGGRRRERLPAAGRNGNGLRVRAADGRRGHGAQRGRRRDQREALAGELHIRGDFAELSPELGREGGAQSVIRKSVAGAQCVWCVRLIRNRGF